MLAQKPEWSQHSMHANSLQLAQCTHNVLLYCSLGGGQSGWNLLALTQILRNDNCSQLEAGMLQPGHSEPAMSGTIRLLHILIDQLAPLFCPTTFQ